MIVGPLLNFRYHFEKAKIQERNQRSFFTTFGMNMLPIRIFSQKNAFYSCYKDRKQPSRSSFR
ncbi:hypothetical protein Bind_0336 [Beijerinckia indica subsp. indica ATCC 9039]|uniref:Uncharacterized protein n=1 Tax=Beijerinckia indica subsp. indica (strain ATCC 9039 / DSM 1715 / NCIMB 8712) TaxID=395963 RepID=B2IDD8_BEII9|nr:hypothetical protein Bind_0336 [Beijerinckia indica subsp. indica ATCC 9039]